MCRPWSHAARILVRASDEAIRTIEAELGDYLIVEPMIPHTVAR